MDVLLPLDVPRSMTQRAELHLGLVALSVLRDTTDPVNSATAERTRNGPVIDFQLRPPAMAKNLLRQPI